jgi:hypothetical protein
MIPRGAEGTDIGRHLQEVGAEIGVTTGRKRRCGWLDVPVIQYGHMINNYQSINLTKLDVMDDLDEVKIGVCVLSYLFLSFLIILFFLFTKCDDKNILFFFFTLTTLDTTRLHTKLMARVYYPDKCHQHWKI